MQPVFKIYNDNNQICYTFKIAAILFSISTIVTLFLIDWGLFFIWNALPYSHRNFGLSINGNISIQTFVVYWMLHNSPMHLSYVLLLFGLGLTGKDITVIQTILLLSITIIILPIIIWMIGFVIATVLSALGSSYMICAIRTNAYIGASTIAWSFIGLSNRKDYLVYIAALFPFFYKLLISHVYDFTPDIAHLCGYATGYFIIKLD